jgi:hypothetical protein
MYELDEIKGVDLGETTAILSKSEEAYCMQTEHVIRRTASKVSW